MVCWFKCMGLSLGQHHESGNHKNSIYLTSCRIPAGSLIKRGRERTVWWLWAYFSVSQECNHPVLIPTKNHKNPHFIALFRNNTALKMSEFLCLCCSCSLPSCNGRRNLGGPSSKEVTLTLRDLLLDLSTPTAVDQMYRPVLLSSLKCLYAKVVSKRQRNSTD